MDIKVRFRNLVLLSLISIFFFDILCYYAIYDLTKAGHVGDNAYLGTSDLRGAGIKACPSPAKQSNSHTYLINHTSQTTLQQYLRIFVFLLRILRIYHSTITMASQDRVTRTGKAKAPKTTKISKTGKTPRTISKKNPKKKATKLAAKAGATKLPIHDLNVLFPPLGSEAAKDQTAEKEATDILKAIYHDINAHCNYERIAKSGDSVGRDTFHNLLAATEGFVEQEMREWKLCAESFKAENGEFQSVSPTSRFFAFVNELGWKMFAICAHAEAFRRWFRTADPRVWGFVCQKIYENFCSIQVYAHNYELKWRNTLWIYQDIPIAGLPDIKPVIQTYMNWKVDHPHHTVITLDGKLKEPLFNGQLQEHIDEYVFDPAKWNGKPDPTLRREPRGDTPGVGSVCFLCGSEVSCACQLQSRAAEFVELTEYPDRGTGVRALTDFRRHDVLGIFIGEIIPNCVEDLTYPLTQSSDDPEGFDHTVGTIAPHRYGNWTRFINHSCESSTWFVTRTIGKRVVTTIEAIRDIKAFEEITVNYGTRYWSGADRRCLCGQASCISNESE